MDRAKLTLSDELLDTVRSAIPNYILKYIDEANVNISTESLYERVVDLRILPIGRIGNDRQIFAETTISPNGKVREGSRLDAFSLVMTAREGNIAVHRIDLLPGGGDASGRIILKAACDINSDGFADIFWIEAGCCGYIIEYDGASWVRPGRITPM